jgi:hypothetical protein
MFTRSELENALGELLDLFPSAFSNARMKRITEILKGVALDDIKRISSRMVDSSRYAPLPEDFKQAIIDLGIKKSFALPQYQHKPKQKKIEIAYLEGDWFFDDEKVFKRGKSVRDCATVYRKDEPDHPMVKKAFEKEKLCLEGKAKFIPAAGSGFPDPSKETLDFFYPLNKSTLLSFDLEELVK